MRVLACPQYDPIVSARPGREHQDVEQLGAEKALNLGFGVVQAMIVGTITAVGGGTIRDVMIGRIPTVLRSELYAIPALIGAGCAAAATSLGYLGTLAALGAAAVCFVIRMIGVRFDLDAPQPPGHP